MNYENLMRAKRVNSMNKKKVVDKNNVFLTAKFYLLRSTSEKGNYNTNTVHVSTYNHFLLWFYVNLRTQRKSGDLKTFFGY